MPTRTAISWAWATDWLKANLAKYIKEYADDPQELKEIAGELIEDEVLNIYNRPNYPEKKSYLLSLKDLYESLQSMVESEWNDVLNYIYPNLTDMIEESLTYEKPSFQQIMENIEPRQQMSMEDVDQLTEQTEQIETEIQRPIENIMIKHPKTRQDFLAGPGKKVYNSNRRDVGIIDAIYENHIVVKDEETGQLTEWPLTDQIWESQ
jgi:hypothetical protein